jgi:hypothetical protein
VVEERRVVRGGPDGVHARVRWAFLQNAQERDEVFLFRGREAKLQHQVEELDGVLERERAAVVKVRRAVLDAPQREARRKSKP